MTALTPRERVLRALDALLPYLHGFVNQAFDATAYRGKRIDADIGPLAHAIKDEWRGVFAARLDAPVRDYVHELLDIRNRLSHSKAFDDEEGRRACDTIRLVAKAIGAQMDEYDLRVAAAIAPAGAPTAAEKAQTSPGALRVAANGGRRPIQRDVMRAIWERCAPDESRAIRQYAAAERRGEVPRKRNTLGTTPEQYAKALLADGRKKGWLDDSG